MYIHIYIFIIYNLGKKTLLCGQGDIKRCLSHGAQRHSNCRLLRRLCDIAQTGIECMYQLYVCTYIYTYSRSLPLGS